MKSFQKAFLGSLILAFLVGLTPAWSDNAPVPAPANEKSVMVGKLSGTATVVRNGDSHRWASSDEGMEILATDRIILAKDETCYFTFADGRKVKFTGEGEYSLRAGEIKISRGGLMVSFTSSAKGYKVRLPTATLGIRGTLLHILVDGVKQWVWVDEGCIEWENGTVRGIMSTGQGMKFDEKNQKPITQSPLAVKFNKNAPKKTEEQPASPEKDLDKGKDTETDKDKDKEKTEKKPVQYFVSPPFSE